MKIDTLQILILMVVIAISVSTAVYATSLNWTSSNRVRVTTASLSVYTDQGLTQPASASVDWGTLYPGEHKIISYWIKNDSNNALTLSWTSDLDSNSVTGYLSDSWSWNDGQSWRDLQGYMLSPEGVIATQYVLTISTITPAGSYTWNLSLSGS